MLLMNYTEIADLFTERWAEILGWISIPTIATALLCGLIKIIVACINRKVGKGTFSQINTKIEEIIAGMNNTLEQMKTYYEGSLSSYADVMQAKINEVMDKYSESKKVAYEKIMCLNEELNKKVGELEETIVDVEGIAKVVNDAIDEEAVEKVVDVAEKVDEVIAEKIEEETNKVETKVEEITDIIENIER